MELRSCEEKANEITALYDSLRIVSGLAATSLPILDDSDNAKTKPNESSETSNVDHEVSLEQTVKLLQVIQQSLHELAPKMEKFRKRQMEKDPVTGNPRYGERTLQRVTRILKIYDFLKLHIPSTENEEGDTNPLLQLKEEYIRQQQVLEQERSIREQHEQLAKQREVERERKIREEEELQQQHQKEQEELARKQQEQLVHQRAEEVRQARLLKQREEKEWFDNITKGGEGVKLYVTKLKESTSKEPAGVQATALQSLLRIYQQINAHPEEARFRRIRRDHEQFVQDVGRFEGGVEVLIAGGFVLGAIDDVPCYISKEPDIENDMDGWSAWFDLNKLTLEILEQAVAELGRGIKVS
eukprot:scaffold248_cov111-Cylindrotheca_fusiformis.AAC.14